MLTDQQQPNDQTAKVNKVNLAIWPLHLCVPSEWYTGIERGAWDTCEDAASTGQWQ